MSDRFYREREAIPTPGAASELLLVPKEPTDEMLHAGMGAVVREVENGKDGHSYYPLFIYRAMVNAAPPAPVMEGAQREAVAWRYQKPGESAWRVTTDEVEAGFIQHHRECHVEPLYTAPPPTDRVQPERVDAGAGTAALRRVYEAARRYFRNEAESAVVCTNNLNRIRDAIEDVKLIDGGYEPAPPTDASGGVTEAMVEAALHATFDHDDAFDSEDRKLMRAALEAADRARKQTPVATQPVDASAQADAPELTSADFPYPEHEKVIRAQAASACDWDEALDCLNAVANEAVGGNWKWAKAIVEQGLAAPTPVAAYREVTLDDAGAFIRANSQARWIAEDSEDLRQRLPRDRVLIALRSIGAIIRTTDAPTYRPCTFADAERIKASADGVPPLESETNDMLAALNKHGAVIRADGQQAQPE